MSDLLKRFHSYYDINTNGCWVWNRSLFPEGYGRFRAGKQMRGAHRVGYELIVGSVPEGLVLDHLCRNRACVNPSHLEPVTNRENILRGVSLQAANAVAKRCVNGHEFSSENTYTHRGERSCRACNREAVRRYSARKRADRMGTR